MTGLAEIGGELATGAGKNSIYCPAGPLDPAVLPDWLHQTKITDSDGQESFGFELCGAAIGQQGFIRHYLSTRVAQLTAEIQDHSKLVSRHDAQVSHALNRLSWQTKPDYLIATHLRSDTEHVIGRLDGTTRRALEDALAISAEDPDETEDDLPEPELSRSRIFMPARHGGTGVLRLADRVDAIFVSTLMDCLSTFPYQKGEDGELRPGLSAIGERSIIVDPYGFALSNWNGMSRTPLHNALVNSVAYFMRAAGSAKVEPRDLLLAETGALQPLRSRPRAPQQTSIIPDILYSTDCLAASASQQQLYDVKTLGGGANNYTNTGRSDPKRATDARADKVAGEYRNKARKIDHDLDTTLAADQLGELERSLTRYGGVRGLCFGFYAEASRSVHQLVKELAEKMVETSEPHRTDNEKVGDPAVAKRIKLMERKLGLVCAFGWAQLKLQALFRIRSKQESGVAKAIAAELEQDEEIDENAVGSLHGNVGAEGREW